MSNIKGQNPLLSWLGQMVDLYANEEVKIPETYREQVLHTKKLLEEDTSGIVNAMLDFAINGALVQYTVETDNENLTELLNDWLESINSQLRGKIPTGINSLAKEYFRERWKGSSQLLLRALWAKKDGFILPSKLWFVDGEDIITDGGKDEEVIDLDKISYKLRKNKEESIPLPKKEETIYVQKPFDSWSTLNPIPYLIRRGLYRNLSVLKLLEKKGEKIITKALEYLLMIKKGTERLFLEGHVGYDKTDLESIKSSFTDMLNTRNNTSGVTTHVANFDTEVGDYIPDYAKGLKQELYTPIERRLLFGLGMIDIVTGTSSSRRESTLNPKPFVNEVNQGIEDFKKLLEDVMEDIIDKNKATHRKYAGRIIRITSTPIKIFVDDKFRTMLRSLYDRGILSKRTFAEVVGEVNFNIEVDRRKYEKDNKLDEVCYPPVIMNTEKDSYAPDFQNKENIPSDKTGIEKINYLQSNIECPICESDVNFSNENEEEYICFECGEIITRDEALEIASEGNIIIEQEIARLLEEAKVDITKDYIRIRQKEPRLFEKRSFRTITLGDGIKAIIGKIRGEKNTTLQSYLFPKDQYSEKEAERWIKKHKGSKIVFEESPYTNTNYPAQLKNLPQGGKTLWIKVFNRVYKDSNGDDDKARQAAWHDVKLKYKKVGNQWKRK